MSLNKQPLTRGEKILLGFVIGFVALVISLTCWWEYLEAMPVVDIPTPVMPFPNAYDIYVQAANMPYKRPFDFDDYSYNSRDRRKIIPGAARPWVWNRALKEPKNKSIDEGVTIGDVARYLALLAPQIATLRKGFQFTYHYPPIRDFNAFSKLRKMARLLRLSSKYKELKGDYGGSINDTIDCLHFGTDVSRGTMICSGVGCAIESMGRSDVWARVPQLTEPQARIAAFRLEKIILSRSSYSDTLREEKWFTQAGLMEEFQKPRAYWIRCFSNDRDKTLPLWFISKRAIMADYISCMDAEIARDKLPYKVTGEVVPYTNDPMGQGLAYMPLSLYIKFLNNMAQDAMLTVALALQAFYQEHKSYPRQLSDLVTQKYLTKIPDDPFANKKTLKYRITHTGYLLYSIGPNGKDDDGKPCLDGPGTKSNNPLRTSSKGDIVAGVNTY